MQALPIFINITNRLCVVIGGGEVATRKVAMLLKANAAVTLISPDICPELQALAEAQKIQYTQASYTAAHLQC
ncbi:MAG: precorrin-2 dehydrogenase/sirohydrochlorin ferrochelatase family protein, partial [Methylotenera sp.]